MWFKVFSLARIGDIRKLDRSRLPNIDDLIEIELDSLQVCYLNIL